MLWEAIKLANQSVRRNALRSILTLLGIVIGVGAVIAMVTIGNGTTQKVTADLSKLGSNMLIARPERETFGPGGSGEVRSFKERDVSALREPGMAELVSNTSAGVVLMHMQGTPQTMQDAPRYDDVVAEVRAYLIDRIAWCEARGIPRARIAVDPGIGFGKTFEHNMALLRNLDQFANLSCILLIGISRKGLLKQITGRGMAQRSTSSVVCSLAGCRLGAGVVRVHDVGPMVDAIRVWNDVIGWESKDG